MGHLLLTEMPVLQRVELNQILVPLCGHRMDTEHVLQVAASLKDGSLDPPPVLLEENGWAAYRLKDGRHRFAACMLAGRTDILAIVGRMLVETEPG